MEFEIHFAAEENCFSDNLAERIIEMGFSDDGLLFPGVAFPADSGVKTECCPLIGLHVTWSTLERDAYMRQLSDFKVLMQNERDLCVGYAHAEVIKPEWDIDISLEPFDPAIEYPVERFDIDVRDHQKLWDIHISAKIDTLDSQLQSIFVECAGMYYIDVEKRDGRPARIFTIQGTNSVQVGLALFKVLKSYIRAAGGMEGAIKFEQTCFWDEYGDSAIVPPTAEHVILL